MHSETETSAPLRRLSPIMAAWVLVASLWLAGCALELQEPGRAAEATVSPPGQPTGNATLVPGATPTLPPFTSQPAHNPGVADLLRKTPPAGQSIEVDAYFDGAGVPPMPGPPPLPDQVVCPQEWNSTLTDRPYPVALMYLNTTQGSPLPDDAPWLVAATPDQTRSGARSSPQLPYHARLRGHLGDPAFINAQCQHADRIFVVEQVVKVYQQDLPDPSIYQLKAPADYARWPRYADATLGYSLPYPPAWQAQRLDDITLALRGPQWPGNPVLVRVHDGELRYDQYNPAALPPLLQDAQGWGVFQQGGWPFDQATPAPQGLDGYEVQRDQAGASENSVAVLFAGNGRTYELALTYPIGFGASPALLADYTAIVQGFRLDTLPGPSPTPPVKQELGAGPFLDEEQAFQATQQRAGAKLDLLSARLVSEAESRRLGGPCATYTGHPDSVWLLVVRGLFEEQERTVRLYLDAKDGEQLCGEEVSAVELEPAATATPYPPGIPTPAPTLAPRDQRASEVTQVTLDVFSGRPNPSWPLLLDQDQALRALLDPLAEVACRTLDLPLGYRGLVVYLGQRPELSNEYRLRVYHGQVRFGDPWDPQAPAVCQADPDRRVERFLLETGRPQLDPALLDSLAQEPGLVVPTPAAAGRASTPTPARPTASTSGPDGTVRATAQVPVRSTALVPATWTPVPASSAQPTAYPTPTPAPFPGKFQLTLSAVPAKGASPLTVRLQATLAGGPDNSYELYCAAQTWELGDGQSMSVMPDCVPWTPAVRISRSFETEHTYERPGTYLVRLLVGNAPFGLSSNVVTIEVR